MHYQRLECGFGYAAVSGTTLTGTLKSDREGRLHRRRTGTRCRPRSRPPARPPAAKAGSSRSSRSGSRIPWPAGPITIRVTEVDADGAGPLPNQTGNFGETGIILNALGGKVAPVGGQPRGPAKPVEVNGEVYEIEHVSVLTVPKQIPVAGP